jgi:hypothetical protein
MTALPRALAWRRTDTTGGEFVLFDDRRGLTARGSAFAATPVKYVSRYELVTNDSWESTGVEVTAEGEGWRRTLRMERTAGRWRVTASEHGNLNAVAPTAPLAGSEDPDRLIEALDVDLYDSPLTNTLPIRRLDLLAQAAGATYTIVAAWILLPSLAVIPLAQTYASLGDGKIRYASGAVTTDLSVDEGGFVTEYPRLATR